MMVVHGRNNSWNSLQSLPRRESGGVYCMLEYPFFKVLASQGQIQVFHEKSIYIHFGDCCRQEKLTDYFISLETFGNCKFSVWPTDQCRQVKRSLFSFVVHKFQFATLHFLELQLQIILKPCLWKKKQAPNYEIQ